MRGAVGGEVSLVSAFNPLQENGLNVLSKPALLCINEIFHLFGIGKAEIVLLKQPLAEQRVGSTVREQIVTACAESNDVDGLLEGIANIIIDHFSDAFTLDLVEDDGTIRRYITRHVNQDTQIEIEELRTRFPLPATAAYGYPRVIKTGKSQFMPGVSPRLIHRLFANPDARMMIDGLSVRSFICVPLIAYGRTLGALTVIRTDKPNPFTSADLLLIEDLAPIIAKCLDDRFSHTDGKIR